MSGYGWPPAKCPVTVAAWCGHCHEELRADGPLGYTHQDGSMYGEDGHAVLPVFEPSWRR